MDRVFNITTTGATVPEVPLDDRSNLMIIVVCVLIPFISTVVALRIYTRARLVKTIGIDDWVVLLSLVRVIFFLFLSFFEKENTSY